MRTRNLWILSILASFLAAAAAAFFAKLPPTRLSRERAWWQDRAKRDNVPIDFYAKVVEQNGTPIVGATIQLRLSTIRPELFPQREPLTAQTFSVTTDEDGLFAVNSRNGTSLQVTEVSKPGYRSDLKFGRSFDYSPRYHANSRHYPDPAAPVVFYMWKKGTTEPLIERNRVYAVHLDHSPITIDLMTGKSQPGRIDTGNLEVSMKRPEGLLYPRPPYDWEFDIKAINGGIVETSDVFAFQAPETGYQEEYKYALRSANVEGGHTAKKRYYVRGRDGSFFASVEVEANSAADTTGEPWGAFYIHYWLNPAARATSNLIPQRS